MAWSDHEWTLEGAAVNVSIVGFDGGVEASRTLDGGLVERVNVDLSGDTDAVGAGKLPENSQLAFQGPVKVGNFDISLDVARDLLSAPNPRPASNIDVIRPWLRGEAIVKREEPTLIIDFEERKAGDAAQYAAPFEYLIGHVKGFRAKSTDRQRREFWWRLGRSGADFRRAVASKRRYLATCQTAKHRLFIWSDSLPLPAQTVIAFGRDDDYFMGVLHSGVHEIWGVKMGTQLEDRPRYTPSTTFETFPLPWPPDKEDVKHPAYLRIAEAAKTLNEQRERWLNPPEWIELLAAKIDAADTFEDVPKEARALVRQSAIMAAAAKDARLKKRTLTNLYNERPTWLKLAHERLDRAVLAAYAAIDPDGDWSEDWAEVWVETGAGQQLKADHTLAGKRAEVDQRVLANLLRLNHARATGNGEPVKPDTILAGAAAATRVKKGKG
jgi:hypothetical protein